MADEHVSLLPSDRPIATARGGITSYAAAARCEVKYYLNSKTGHYSILLLVSLDVTAIFADLLLAILTCEGRVPPRKGNEAQEILGIVSLVFSCLFMVSGRHVHLDQHATDRRRSNYLRASGRSGGSEWSRHFLADQANFSSYFTSWFHCLDTVVITAAFVIDVLLRGIVEEVGSLVVILRLWRVIKIIEELSAGAEEQMESLHERLEALQLENGELKREIEQLRRQKASRNI